MHKMAISALAAVFAFFAPNLATAAVVGQVAFGYENTEFDYNSDYYCECYFYGSDSYHGPNVSAAIAAPLHGDDGPWMIQGEGRLQSQESDYYYESYNENSGHAALHIGHRTDDHGVAGFYGIQNWYGHDIQEIGVEVQKYFANMTAQGSAAYGKHDGPYWDEYDAWDVQANATYYFNQNWSAGIGVGYASFDYYGGDTDMTTVEVNGEYRIPNSRYSVRAAYVYGDADDTYIDYTADMFQISLIMDLGSGGTQARDQHGASWSGAEAFDTHWRLWQGGFGYIN